MLHNREDPSFLVLTEALGFYKGEGTNHFQRRLDNVQAPGLSNRLVDLRITQLGPSFDYLSDKQRIKIEFFERNSLD